MITARAQIQGHLTCRIVYGARISLLVGFCATIGSTLLQMFFGLTSAYFGGLVDEVLSLIINVFLILPDLPLTVVLASLANVNAANKSGIPPKLGGQRREMW